MIGHQRISQIVEQDGEITEHYFTFDGHGSTRVLTDVVGAVAQIYAFDAYGNAIDFNTNEALTEFLYSGEQFDAKIGQQYLRQRYYDPATGRFNRLDPFFGNLSDPQSLHKYAYVHADPVNGIDPSGMMWGASMLSSLSIQMKIGMSVGATVGGVMGGYIGYKRSAGDPLQTAGFILGGVVLGAGYGALTAAYGIPFMLAKGSSLTVSATRIFGATLTASPIALFTITGFGDDVFDMRLLNREEAKYVANLMTMISNACDEIGTPNASMNKQCIHSVFIAGQKITPDNNYAMYKESVLYGKRIVLGSQFFDLNAKDIGQHPVIEHVQTILHESYHANGQLDETSVEKQAVKFSHEIAKTIAYKSFIAQGGTYDSFMLTR